jgi:LPXTG-motif cell wall-anchored protein
MHTRRIVAGGAAVLAATVLTAGPVAAYPLERPEVEPAGQGVTEPTEVAGVGGGLADTGGDLTALYGGLALVLAGGTVVLVTRRRRGAVAD